MAWVDILGEGGGGDGDGECCPSSGAAWPGLAGAAVCLWPSASVCLFEGMVPRAGRAARHRPAATSGSPRSLVTAWHSPAQHTLHRHQDHHHRRWFKGDTGPGGRGWSTHHSTARTCGVLVCWCVGVSPPGVFPLLVVAVCRGPAQPRRLEKALDVADSARCWARGGEAGRLGRGTRMINDDGTVLLLLARPQL